ncbi:type II toxin-antitoxin system RelE family toxin [Amycolatopsis pithecellobii]|uniref:Type II toxin-antitoxin system RelE/ParE family toxin n=1 Tax=Amycolatopsis pithecellobii TaxID=664692 RepID=A0A6N7YIV9_9PSEU|nr:type II toxin-antitoxin system RelE/ParE family toxin [Amycolatopsis pithecellobii]MTD52855.1 type II toxin-antitoxin system RelE/ParE family toxin [Amycolatopsis pithecellobii]
MSQAALYAVEFSPAARRRLAKLPLSAATALYEHLIGPVAGNPYRLGKPLDEPFNEVWTTRRGDYRALYSIDDHERTITVLAVAHRRDAYRPH